MLFLNKVTFTGSVGSEYGHTFCRGPSRNSLQDDTESFLLWVVGGWQTRLHTPVILLFFFSLFILIMINKSVSSIRYLGTRKERGRWQEGTVNFSFPLMLTNSLNDAGLQPLHTSLQELLHPEGEVGAGSREFQPQGPTLRQTHPVKGLGTEHLGFPTGGRELPASLAGARRQFTLVIYWYPVLRFCLGCTEGIQEAVTSCDSRCNQPASWHNVFIYPEVFLVCVHRQHTLKYLVFEMQALKMIKVSW